MARASILVPTHDAARTLDLSVASASRQTVEDLDIVIIGDGVTPEVQEVARGLVAADPRVRFLDLPKAPHHGESYRDEVVRGAQAPVVCYLCDDDLLLPDHVESMLALLEHADLVNSLNGHLTPGDTFVPYLSDLDSPEHRQWLMRPHLNSVSVTGTAHTVESYLRIPVGWEPPPPGRWTDHVMWQKFLDLPDLRAATSTSVTALQFPSHLDGRAQWSAEERRSELERWWTRLSTERGRAELDEIVRAGLNRRGAGLNHALTDAYARLEETEAQLGDSIGAQQEAHEQVVELSARLQASEQAVVEVEGRLASIEGSRIWRLRGALVRGPVTRLVRSEPPGEDRRPG